MAKDTRKAIEKGSARVADTMDDIKSKLLSYADDIQEYLGKVDAKVENYKFSVEKDGKSLLDAAFKARIRES
ncbi:MAG: hypothetical protein ACRECH_13175 [Nitrososphaerales archaeon]